MKSLRAEHSPPLPNGLPMACPELQYYVNNLKKLIFNLVIQLCYL